MKNSFKKLVALFSAFVMVLGLVVVPNVSAEAAEAKGEVTFANDYDWDNTGKGIYVFASANAEDYAAKLCPGQPADFFQWNHTIVLERNKDYNYVVKSTTPGCEGNTADRAPLGVGRLVISFNGPEGAEAAHPESYAFFMSLKEGDVVTPSHYWEAFATASGATSFSFTMAKSGSKGPKAPTKGAINVVNGRGTIAMGDGASYATDIIAVATKDSSKVAAQIIGSKLNYWNSILVEKTENDTWKVIGVDTNPTDNYCSLDGEKLGEGRILIAIHAGVADKDSAAFFLGTAQIGQEYYLIGEIPAEDITSFEDGGTTLSGVYFTTVKPGTEVEEETGSDEGTGSDEEIKNTGDNFVPMFVVLFAGLAIVTVATVARKRNA